MIFVLAIPLIASLIGLAMLWKQEIINTPKSNSPTDIYVRYMLLGWATCTTVFLLFALIGNL